MLSSYYFLNQKGDFKMGKLAKWGGLIMGILTVVGGGCEIASWAIENKMNKEENNEIPSNTNETRT